MADANGAGMDHDRVADTHSAWNGSENQRYWQIQYVTPLVGTDTGS
jgi:hypothetical protein